MSSIPQQELMKPAPKSPIPRSRSDFSYVGLTPKEKRWTTDFSLLLPPYSRDSSGYSRLAESPVTLQPKPRNQAVVKLSKSPTLDQNAMQSLKSNEAKPPGKSPTSEPGTSSASRTSSNHDICKTFKDSKPLGRSQTMEPYIANGGFSSSNHSNEYKQRTVHSRTMSRSPTLEPYATNYSYSNESKRSIASKTLSRNPNHLDNHIPKCSSSCSKTSSSNESKTLYPRMELSPIGCPKVSHKLSPLTNPSTSECSRHLSSIRKSPTMDSKTLRYSPLLNQQIISRSPTLDPSVLNRSPRCCHSTVANGPVVSRSPLATRGLSSEVVRSQSLRSLQKGTDRSPSKIKTSESAQGDVSCSIHKHSLAAGSTDEDVHRLRNFSLTPKGVINWGDSFRSQSLTSVPGLDLFPPPSSQWDALSTKSYPMTASNSHWNCAARTPQRYRVAIMGSDEVGKTSLIRQFQTSEYICAFDTSYDIYKEYAITVILNKEESELEFIEYRLPDEEAEEGDEGGGDEGWSPPFADAHVVVYSVTSRRSFQRAVDALTKVQRLFRRSAVLLVGNKSDLVRVRAITTDDGQSAAKERSSVFLETSAAINHQVDELLVSILTQIRAKCKSPFEGGSSAPSRWSGPHYSLSKARGLIKKFLKKACFQSKSSDNLQRL